LNKTSQRLFIDHLTRWIIGWQTYCDWNVGDKELIACLSTIIVHYSTSTKCITGKIAEHQNRLFASSAAAEMKGNGHWFGVNGGI
jgi:hypothetical protein